MKYLVVICVCLLLFACVTRPTNSRTARDVEIVKNMELVPRFPEFEYDTLEQLVEQDVTSDIHTFIRFVDARGHALRDVPMDFVVLDTVLEPFDYPYYGFTHLRNYRSDKRGVIEVKTRGAALIGAIASKAYWHEGGSTGILYFADRLKYLNTVALPSSLEEAFVIELQEKPEHAKNSKINTGSIFLNQAAPTYVQLLGSMGYATSPDNADLAFYLTKATDDKRARYDWQLTIQVDGGGLKPVVQLPDQYAPLQGYASSYELKISKDDALWSHRKSLFFYYRSDEGNYAYLEIKVRTKDRAFISIDGTINLHGENILDLTL
ncbi:hypothetical protein [Agaribacterium haliotis]|uniref:hypothetical protein n=1 Tax=Agaribacterium haliotis TaxID=2013869 RepID=UPI000BB57BDC|nr:hypothetical protein [Agaribacterium haliotis]